MRTFFQALLFIFFLILIPYQIFNEYINICPNKEFLSWDGDLRAIKTINLAESIRSGNWFGYIFHFLDAPTWPTFRNLLESILLIGDGKLISIENIVYFSAMTAFILLLWIFFFVSKEVKNIFMFILFVLILYSSVYLSKPLLIYSFSAMLEIQGALFFLISIYYLTKLYGESFSIEKNLHWKLFISTFLLFQTKYPYGYLLIITICIFHLLLFSTESIFFITRYLIYISAKFKNNYRWILISMIFFALLVIPSSFLKGKTKSYLKYILVILLCVDYYIYIFKETKELLNQGYARILLISKWIFLPILFFVLFHPDRFTSSSGTLNHIQSEGHLVGEVIEKNFSYYYVFIKSFQDSLSFGNLFLLLSFVSILFGFYQYKKRKQIAFYFVSGSFIFITIFILTFFTSNHQARHIYHLIPTFLLGSLFFLKEDFKKWNLLKYILLLFLTFFLSKELYIQLKENFKNREICFSGKNTNDYYTPRFIYKIFQEQKYLSHHSIVLNGINPMHANKADTELVLNKLAYETKTKVIFDPKRLNQYRTHIGKSLYFISDTCNEKILPELNTYLSYLNPSFKIGLEFDSALKKEVIVFKESLGSVKLLYEEDYFSNESNLSTREGCIQIFKFKIVD